MAEAGDRRAFLLGGAAIGLAAAAPTSNAPPAGLYRAVEPSVLLDAVRGLLGEDRLATLITVDAQGRPRARTVFVSTPDADLTLWIGTRRGSRKLDQLAGNPNATIHFSDDGQGAYASLIGRARPVADPALVAAKAPYSAAMRKQFFPDYPNDFMLIAFTPEWLEVMTDKLPGTKATWQPQGMAL